MYLDFFIYTAEALALAANGQQTFRTNIDNDADFLIFEQAGTALSRDARIRQAETSSGRLLQDVPVPYAGYFGDGRRPWPLPIKKRLKRASTFTTSFTDESGAPNQLRVAYIGAKDFKHWPFPKPEYVRSELFTYTAPFVPIAMDPEGVGAIPAGGTLPFTIRIQEDADFEIHTLTIVHDIPIPAGSDSVATIVFQDETYGYRFMDRPVPVENLGGARIIGSPPDTTPAGFYPFRLPVPKLIRHGSALSVTVNNLDGVNPLEMRVTFYGAKRYTEPPV